MLDPNTEETRLTRVNGPLESTQPVNTTTDSPGGTGSTEDTQLVQVMPPPDGRTAPVPVPVQIIKIRRWPIILGGILLVLLLSAGGAYLGYRAAIDERAQAFQGQSTQLATEQFMLGMQEQAAGHYDLALRHYEYVIQLDPNFPGIKDKLAETMLAGALARTPTLTVEILPTITIAPRMRFTPKMKCQKVKKFSSS